MAHAGQPGWPGRIIDGRYAVESVIGSGGMGLVLKARHKFTGAEVALKVLKPDLELDTEIQMRFLAEARAPNAIGHPGIVSVLDAGKAPDGLLYLVMELLVGTPLRVPLARGELAAGDMRRILLELLDALAAAHARGFVHRDLKPENIFLAGPQRQVKLLDFGIAKVLDAGIARVRTATGATLGTPAYMAPEQFHDPSGVDARADLWAVGVMAYEMLAGRLPFRADTTQALLIAVATQEPDPIRAHVPNAPPALEAFFARALARAPAQRFSSAHELAAAIAALPLGAPQAPPARGPAIAAHTPSPAGPIAYAHTPSPAASGAGRSGATMATGAGASLPPRAHTPSATPPTGTPPMTGAPSTGGTGPYPITAPPTVAADGPNKRAWIIGLGLATVVSAAIVVIAVVATRKPADSTTTTAPGPTAAAAASPPTSPAPPSATPPAAPAGPDRTVAPPDASVVASAEGTPTISADDLARKTGFVGGKTQPAPPAPPRAATGTTRTTRPAPAAASGTNAGIGGASPAGVAESADIQTICRAGCDNARRVCANAGPTCVADCVRTPAFRSCLSAKNCTEGSVCAIRAQCGAGSLAGSGSCLEAAMCMSGCPVGDLACGCRCAQQMAPSHARALTALAACAENCGGQEPCLSTNCSIQATSCKNQ